MADRFYAQQTDYIYQLNQLNDFVNLLSGGGGGSYVLPTATGSILGGIKVGTNLTITGGVLSADAAPQVQADWNEPSSSSKAYILNKPVQQQADWAEASTSSRGYILNKPNFALAANLTNVENKSSATIRSEITAANVTVALNYTPSRHAAPGFTVHPGLEYSLAAANGVSTKSLTNPLTGHGYAGGMRARFAHANDIDTAQNYADALDLSTYVDSTGGGFNSLYFNKSTHKIEHKFAPAGSTAWTQVNTIPYANGTHANGTWGIAITGNAATATTLASTRTNYKTVTDAAVVGQLMWKNYGNGYTIFDASASTTPTGAACNNTDTVAAWLPTYPTLMGYNGTDTVGVRVDTAKRAETLVLNAVGSVLNLYKLDKPSIYLWDTDAGSGLGRWGLYVSSGGGNLILGPSSDADVVTGAVSVDRAGHTSFAGYIKADGGIVTHVANGIRMKQSSGTPGYGYIWRQNGTELYLLMTNNNDADGSYNALRPFRVAGATGLVTMDNGLTVSGAATFNNRITGSADINLASVSPVLYYDDTGQTGAAGRWGIQCSAGSLSIVRNTAVARDFSTAVTDLAINNSGVVSAATPALNTNSTQVATTAYVINQAATATPLAAGTAAVGTATTWARADHVHPGTAAGIKMIASVAITNVAALDFLTLFTSEFDSYRIEVLGSLPVSSGAGLILRLAVGGTLAIISGDYREMDESSTNTSFNNPDTSFGLTGAINNTGAGVTGRVELMNMNATTAKQMHSVMVAQYTSSAFMRNAYHGIFTPASVASGFRLYYSAGNFQAVGTVRVYGYSKV